MDGLKSGHYYWIHHIQYDVIYLGTYDANWRGVFFWLGSDETFDQEEVNVLGEVEVPDYIDKTKLEGKYE